MVVNMHDGEALVYLKPALEIMAREGHLKMPPSAQWAHLEGLIALLSPFSCVQEFLEGEKYVTISAVPFLIHAIRTKIDTVVNNADGEFENSVVVSAIAVKVKFQAEWGSGSRGRWHCGERAQATGPSKSARRPAKGAHDRRRARPAFQEARWHSEHRARRSVVPGRERGLCLSQALASSSAPCRCPVATRLIVVGLVGFVGLHLRPKARQ